MEKEKIYSRDLTHIAALISALSHPARLQIIEHLSYFKECPANSVSKELPLSKSTVSQHMTILFKADLIKRNPSGICNNYSLNHEKLQELNALMSQFLDTINFRSNSKTECKNLPIT